ncbi:TetR/AcrR family transcriptional regulator [Rugosimonospora acidiphila]|uniref:TetR/AcrR family transcriptional regulator n=1 Tax=Rugosimonospora acidiphila TaxID=556531 RepID=A0ABP9RU16_9ACTN
MTDPGMPAARRRDASATRAAILASARRAFARAGYDGAGVREIAAGAGVTAMMVNRYFGSKERLFAEAIASYMAEPEILTRTNLESPDFAARIAGILVDITKAGATPLDGFLIMLHSSSSERAAEIGREQIERHYHRTLTETLGGDLAGERAGILLAMVAGVQVMRQMIGLSALAHADPDDLAAILEPLFRQLLAPGAATDPPVPPGRDPDTR